MGPFIQEIECKQFRNSVKPVFNGHPWDPKKVAVVQDLVQNSR